MKRKIMLQAIFGHFQQMTQWTTSNPPSYAKYYHKAEALIEILEIEDCGSIGGFDNKNKLARITKFDLYDRFLTVQKNVKLEPICGFTPLILAEYWKSMKSLREITLRRF